MWIFIMKSSNIWAGRSPDSWLIHDHQFLLKGKVLTYSPQLPYWDIRVSQTLIFLKNRFESPSRDMIWISPEFSLHFAVLCWPYLFMCLQFPPIEKLNIHDIWNTYNRATGYIFNTYFQVKQKTSYGWAVPSSGQA